MEWDSNILKIGFTGFHRSCVCVYIYIYAHSLEVCLEKSQMLLCFITLNFTKYKSTQNEITDQKHYKGQ